jgi:hypothetical protein
LENEDEEEKDVSEGFSQKVFSHIRKKREMFCPNIFLQIQQKDRCMKKGRGEILPVCR